MKKSLILIIFLIPLYLFSIFNNTDTGAYSYAMGGASVAFCKDASSVFINPAALGKSNRTAITLSHQNIFGVPDLYNETLAFNFPAPYTRIGVGTNQLILANQYSEQTYFLSFASIIHIKSFPVYFGLSNKIFYAHADYHGASSPLCYNLDLGLLTNLSKTFSIGFIYKNPLKNKLSFLDYEDEIKSEFEAGLLYNWKNTMNLAIDYNITKQKLKIGWELWFYNVFAPRIGLNGEHLTAGFGLKSKKWALDAAVLAHNSLGSNYKISFTYYIK